MGGGQTTAIQQSFYNAFNRGNFPHLVLATPKANVQALGSPGLIQTFTWAANQSLTAALIDPDPQNANNTFQMLADIYALYIATGSVSTVGYPTDDTTACPPNNYGTCDYQLFTNDYALFVYSGSVVASYSVADPVYTEWNNHGGLYGNTYGALGPAASAATSVTSESGAKGTQQLFAGGAIYNYAAASGTAASAYTVVGAIYTSFAAAGGISTLGFPATEEVTLANGQNQQTFENGTISFTPGGSATVLFPIANVAINGGFSSLTLNVGQTMTLNASAYDTEGQPATGRTLTWTTSNGNAVAIQSNGYSATIQAVAAGSARIQVSGGGKSSPSILVTVLGQCCGIGDGAPTQTITQAFQQAATRNHLSVIVPNLTPVVPDGSGYIQVLTAADGTGTTFVIAESNQSAIAYVIGGALYQAFLANGGFTGLLGYPASDASPGGTQSFGNGAALAGAPVRLVPAPIAAKWIASGAETGPLGEPTAGATAFTSILGTNGNSQTFANGSAYGIMSGNNNGQAFISSGLILARYLALSGPAGQLGAPQSDIFASGVAQRENFETGYIDLQPGATAAVEHYNPQTPMVTTSPATVAPGGTVHITLSGFGFGQQVSVSVTGQSNFLVSVPAGVFSWNLVVPATARPGAVTIQASSGPNTTASGSYTVVQLAALRPSLTVVSGNQQTGAPGATLAAPLVAVLVDSSGIPIPGASVSYAVSPGASATVPAVTDVNGRITASLRLQSGTGIALLSISAGGEEVTFSALLAATSVMGFTGLTQTSVQGGPVAALAAAILYYQNSGMLGSPNGPASAAALGQFLNANGGFTSSETGTALPNPWIAMKFTGVTGGISIEAANLPHVLDLLTAGSPLVLELSVTVDGAPGGSAMVDAIGVNADGSIAIADPNPAFGQGSLNGYLYGFSAGGHNIQGSLTGVIRIAPGLSAPQGFVSAAPASSGQSAASPAGACANSIDLGDPVLSGRSAPAKVGAVRFLECDGTQFPYQLAFATQTGASILDLSGGPSQQIAAGSAPAFQVSRSSATLAVAPQTLAITSVVNSAGFGPGLSPGGFFTIFGSGFTVGSSIPTVTVGGKPAQIIAAFPFQINALLPVGSPAGSALVQVSGPLGTATQSVNILSAAPGIFAIVNQDGTLNSPSNPAARGAYVLFFGTGLGATVSQGSLQVASQTVSVSIGGVSVKPSFAGLAPGFPGLCQINVQIPPGATPGSAITVALNEGGQTSNTVPLAIQ